MRNTLIVHHSFVIAGVVVSSWVGMLNIVRYHLKRYQIRSQTISGEVKISDRQTVVQAFNSEENTFSVGNQSEICRNIMGIFANFRFFCYH